MTFIFMAVVALALSAWLTLRFSRPGSALFILDHPNERSLHSSPTPRSGGVAILLALFATGALGLGLASHARSGILAWIAAGVLLVAMISFLDDRVTLHPGIRLAVHILAAGLLIYGGLSLPAISGAPLVARVASAVTLLGSVVFIVWMINLYNFMDGMDGFAGGMAVIGFGSFAVLGALAGETLFASISLLIAASAAGFLIFNFPPSRIFMGDVGSSSLGLLAAALSLWGVKQRIFPLWGAVLVFSPFIVDASVTLLRRALQGEKVWRPHRTHYYQRLVQIGWGHRKTVLWEYGLMIACSASTIVGVRQPIPVRYGLLAGWGALYVALMLGVHHLEARSRRSQRRSALAGTAS